MYNSLKELRAYRKVKQGSVNIFQIKSLKHSETGYNGYERGNTERP